MNLASAVETGVAEYYANTGSWPGTLTAAGGDSNNVPSGKYVKSVDVGTNGVITITYGNQANTNVTASGKNALTLTPGLSKNNDVAWVCGNHALPSTNITMAVAPTEPHRVAEVPAAGLPRRIVI